MKHWTATQVAAAAGVRLISLPSSLPPPSAAGPERATVDSRDAGPGTLFVGLPGANADGGRFAPEALAAGAWGVLISEEHAQAARSTAPGVVLAAEDPLRALQRLATAWRRELKARVIGVTGSTGKTSTKELLRAVIAPHRRTVASRANFNTEIGLPLEILAAPAGTEVLVLEMGMRGTGQIAELAEIAEPDVGVIVNIGPVHLELLGTLEAIAATKAELIAGLGPDGTAVVPAGETLLAPYLRLDLRTITFGEGGEVHMISPYGDRSENRLEIDVAGESVTLEVSFTQAHLRRNLLAAVAAASAIGVRPRGRVDLEISAGRGRRVELGSGITLIDDCYNANPMSMLAALDELAAAPVRADAARRVAVLGDMLELGPDERRFHVEVGEHARAVGVDLLVTVGPLATSIAEGFGHSAAAHRTADAAEAAALVADLLAPGDLVLVKASRGVGLERVCDAVTTEAPV